MSSYKYDLMSNLVSLTDQARLAWSQEGRQQAAEQAIADQVDPSGSVMLSGLEICDITFTAEHDDRPSVGDVNSHVDQWIDDHGVPCGSVRGQGWKIASVHGQVISYYRETAETARGVIETAGIWNSSAIWDDQWQSLLATGVSGELSGMIGVRQLRQLVPRQRYQFFVLLIPMDAVPDALRDHILRGFAAD